MESLDVLISKQKLIIQISTKLINIFRDLFLNSGSTIDIHGLKDAFAQNDHKGSQFQ